MARIEGAQADRREQARLDHVEHRGGARRIEQLVRERQGQDLVGPHAIVELGRRRAVALIDAVVEAAGGGVPEQLDETAARPLRVGLELGALLRAPETDSRAAARMRSALYQSAWISTGFPRRGRHHPVADARVHPGELHARLAGVEQAVVVDVDAVARAAAVPGEDVLEHAAGARRARTPRRRSRPGSAGSRRRTTAWRRRCCTPAVRRGPGSGSAACRDRPRRRTRAGSLAPPRGGRSPGRVRAARSWCRGPSR